MTEKSSYRQIFKATSVFGGVQVYNILINIIKTKIIAILLGTTGVGIISLFNSVVLMVNQLSGMGIDQSGVRDIAEAYSSGNSERISKTLVTVRRLVWITGFIGFLICFVFAPILSRYTFGSTDYTFSFMLLALVLLFTQLGNGQSMLLRGTRQIKKLAKSSMIGTTISLFISVPLFYFWGNSGIVPALVLSSLSIAIIFWFFAKSIPVKAYRQTLRQTFQEGGCMIKLGIMLTLSALLGSVISYGVRAYISVSGGFDDVGLFSAGFMIIETYVGMVFTAMATDFYPRLAAVRQSNSQLNLMTNQQAIIALLIVAPLIIAFIIFAPYVLAILYSEKFVGITLMIQLAVVGILFRTASWSGSFILLAKAETKLYFLKELFSASFMMVCYVIGYHYWGLTGIGVAFVIAALFHFFVCYLFVFKSSGFKFSREYLFILFIQLGVVLVALGGTFCENMIIRILIYSICFIVSVLKSYNDLNKKVGIRMIIQRRLSKRN